MSDGALLIGTSILRSVDLHADRTSGHADAMDVRSAGQTGMQSGEDTSDGVLRNHFAPTGLVEVSGVGVWSVAYVDEHFAALERGLKEIRSRFGRARVLVNLSKAPAQPLATAERISYWTDRIYLDTDRVAVLVDSMQLQAQMKTRVMIADFDVFISEVAARLWLFQH